MFGYQREYLQVREDRALVSLFPCGSLESRQSVPAESVVGSCSCSDPWLWRRQVGELHRCRAREHITCPGARITGFVVGPSSLMLCANHGRMFLSRGICSQCRHSRRICHRSAIRCPDLGLEKMNVEGRICTILVAWSRSECGQTSLAIEPSILSFLKNNSIENSMTSWSHGWY